MNIEKISLVTDNQSKQLGCYSDLGGDPGAFRSVFDNAMQRGSRTVELHSSNETDGKALGATADENFSVTVFKPVDFDESAPVYTVKVWDSNGIVSELPVDPAKVDPSDASFAEMYALSCCLTDSGRSDDAQMIFSRLVSNLDGAFSGDYTKRNWIELAEEMMNSHYRAGNLKDYMDLKHFTDILSE